MNNFLLDAPTGLAFLIGQLAYIESKVFEKKYRRITYPDLIPITTEAPEFIDTVLYESIDIVGEAKAIGPKSMDVPLAEMGMSQHSQKVSFSAIGYSYTDIELGQAKHVGRNLTITRASAARRAYEERLQKIFFLGEPELGLKGLFNHPDVGLFTLPTNKNNNCKFEESTPDEILKMFNSFIGDHVERTNMIETFSKILLPVKQYNHIAHERLYTVTTDTGVSVKSGDTILDFIASKSPYIKNKNDIVATPELKGAGLNGNDRMIGYEKDSEKLIGHIPMPLKWLAPERRGLGFIVPAMFSSGGTEIRYPGSVLYADGI